MKMTKGRLEELEIIKGYIPSNCKWEETTPEHVKMYFDMQERGIKVWHGSWCRCGFCALYWGRIWRDRNAAMQKEEVERYKKVIEKNHAEHNKTNESNG